MKKVKCINNGKFNFITVGKVYNIEKETRDFYFISNDSSSRKRYGKSHFELVESKKKTENKVGKPAVKREKTQQIAICQFVKPGLTYKKKYPYTDSKDVNKISITNDRGEKSLELKKRFSFE